MRSAAKTPDDVTEKFRRADERGNCECDEEIQSRRNVALRFFKRALLLFSMRKGIIVNTEKVLMGNEEDMAKMLRICFALLLSILKYIRFRLYTLTNNTSNLESSHI